MFSVHNPIIRNITCCVAAYGFLTEFWIVISLESRWVVHVYGADDAVMVELYHPHRKHDLPSGSQDDHPSKNSVQKTICCNSTSNAPDDGRMYVKSRKCVIPVVCVKPGKVI